ncbi:2676_t:CDS:10 [Diversispora eburnea]|uniref:2676_t:CDS:1 n=1 Tax=Diversispora eburnea TaxID=1213867 RepID=A0A9N9BMN8_9GLOM|nr:2676_t:CDS:10 [Diversispora eburnea]
MQQRAVSKLEKLLNNYDKLFSAKEIEQFINDLKRKEEEKDLYTSVRRNMTVAYNVEAEKDYHQNKAMLRKLHDDEDQDEIASDVVSDASDLCDDQMRELDDIEELEASGNKRKDCPEEKWTLSTGKDVYVVLNDPAYFGILDLSGEEPEVKELFTIEEWAEMQEDFSKTVMLTEMDSKEEELLYNLFDKIEEVLKRKSDDIITDIEECIIKTDTDIVRFPQLSMSEGSFSNNFTNMMTKGIITYNRKCAYDEGEIQSLSSAMIANLNKKPVDRSLIGQRCDFRITCDGFESVIGLRSGGLPEACHSKKWTDKVDLMVAMRDVLLKEAIEDNGVECKDFRNLYTLGVHSYAKGLWRLGLLKKIKLPQSNDQLLMIEKLTTLLLRIESTLDYIMPIRNELAVKASRLHRNRRSSICLKPYTFAEQGRIRRTRIQRDS